jgi:threonine/homoserine/homoserine lactone efflux protein
LITLNWKSWTFLLCAFSVIVAKMSNIDPRLQFVCVLVAALYIGWYCYDSYNVYKMACPGELEENLSLLWNDRMKKNIEKMEKRK